MNNSIVRVSDHDSEILPPLAPRVRLLWLLRAELNLSVNKIRALRWIDLSSGLTAHPRLAQAIVEYRNTLAPKSFLLHPDAPVFASRKRGVGGRQTPISRQQMDEILRPVRVARHGG